MSDDQLTDIFELDYNNVLLSEVQEKDIPSKDTNAAKMKYKMIYINTVYGGGKTGKLIISTMKNMFCFGVQINKNPSGEFTGHSVPICLVGRKEDTIEEVEQRKNERLWLKKVSGLFDYIAEKTVEKRKQLKIFNLEKKDVKNPIYIKLDDDGVPVEGKSPMLYPKVIESKKTGKVATLFENEDGEPVDMKTLMDTQCKGEMAIHIQSVYCGGGKVTIQVKLYHAIMTPVNTAPRSILPRRPRAAKIDISKSVNPLNDDDDEETEPEKEEKENDEGSIEEDEPAPKPKKKSIKKVARKKNTE